MYAQNWYINVKLGLASASGDTCTRVQVFFAATKQCHYQSDLENPKRMQMIGLFSIFVDIQS